MKILLVGEYSGLHNSLQTGLQALGHEVLLISTGDFFKKYPSDILLKRSHQKGIAKKWNVLLNTLFGTDLTSKNTYQHFQQHAEMLKDFDVVQLINENPFATLPNVSEKIIRFLHTHNTKLFLLSCGTDYISVSHNLSDAHPYSILQGYKDGSIEKGKYRFILNHVNDDAKKLHAFIFEHIRGVIASDLDYHLPLKEHPKYLGLIPNPVVVSKLRFAEMSLTEPIVIFMGINRGNAHTKGITYFKKALDILGQKFSEKIKIEIVENLPYNEYIEKFNSAHILLDQVFAYDQGYNALEAMAKGKLVFTGAETQFYEHYQLEERVAINALPDVDYLVAEIEKLIENPSEIKAIGERARAFVLETHDHIAVAQQYLDTWNAN